MIITYQEFCDLLLKHIKEGDDFYKSLLINVIDNPTRYCGLFRLSNAKSKLMQNVTQSKEIKFGDIFEELTTEYIARLGYKNFNKHLGKDKNGDDLNVDQYFTDGKNIFVVEMKIRDDHDSTKKRGQYSNFHKKIQVIKKNNLGKHIEAIMWFVDDGHHKNRKYYASEMSKENFSDCSLHLFYGKEFFASLKNGLEAWDELMLILSEYRIENANNDVEVPDFGSSPEILKALVDLPPNYWKKLVSNNAKYSLLREELFNGGNNIGKASKIRAKRSPF